MKNTTVDSLVFTYSQRRLLTKIRYAEVLPERDFITIRAAMNRDVDFARVVNSILAERSEPISVTDAQFRKGLAWLKNQAWTPTGKPRKNNPFGHREHSLILSAEKPELGARFTLDSFQNCGRGYEANFFPVWRLHVGNYSFAYLTRTGEGLTIVA